jgi:hypothetical protein
LYAEVKTFDMQKVLADVSDSSLYTEVEKYSFEKVLADVLVPPITYNPARIYVVGGYVAEGYVKERELIITFDKVLADVSDSSLYVEVVDIVFDV